MLYDASIFRNSYLDSVIYGFYGKNEMEASMKLNQSPDLPNCVLRLKIVNVGIYKSWTQNEKCLRN